MKGFISAPTLNQLQLTPEEQARFRELIDWHESSARCHRIVGGTKFCANGHQNNPNNICCWICGGSLAGAPMTDDFKDMSLVIHGGREEVAVALVKLRRAITAFLLNPTPKSGLELDKVITASEAVVEDREDRPPPSLPPSVNSQTPPQA